MAALRYLVAAAGLIFVPFTVVSQAPAVPHPLSWWTKNPLRLDASGDLMLARLAHDGQIVTPRDYRLEQSVTPLGIRFGHRIVQVITTIYAGPRIAASGWSTKNAPPSQWKSLLVQAGPDDRYAEIYHLQSDFGAFLRLQSAAIYGAGPNAILGTFDPDSGVGGGCEDGYWRFDKTGAHEVDFSPLYHAIDRSIPQNGRYMSRCGALHPEKSELQSWVQSRNAECHACGGLGQVYAKYRIKDGAAIPVTVRFEPEN